MNPFEYLNAINTTKKDLMVDDVSDMTHIIHSRHDSYINVGEMTRM